MLPRPSELFWGRPGPAEGRQKSVWIAEPAAGRRLEHHTGQVHAACPVFIASRAARLSSLDAEDDNPAGSNQWIDNRFGTAALP